MEKQFLVDLDSQLQIKKEGLQRKKKEEEEKDDQLVKEIHERHKVEQEKEMARKKES